LVVLLTRRYSGATISTSFSLKYYLTHYYLGSVSIGYTNVTRKIHI
jgi:hypothetical protein